MKLKQFTLFALIIAFTHVAAQPIQRNIRTPEYRELQQSLAKGWNTWYSNSVLSEALLPESFSVNLCLVNKGNADYLKEIFKASEATKRPEKVILGLRADDGSYTSLSLKYKDVDITVQTATDGADMLMLVTPVHPSESYLVAEAGLLWDATGMVGKKGEQLVGQFGAKTILVSATNAPLADAYAVTTSPKLVFSLQQPIGIYTGRHRSLEEIQAIIDKHRQVREQRAQAYGELAEPFRAMQGILAWNTIYDAPNHRVITPVSRYWNYRWAGGGYVLFDWDTYFASYMLSMFNKKLAYANAIEITKAITPAGFIPNYQSSGRGSSVDRSQPPIGSTVILNIYKKYHEQWFLREVYDELLTWNRWWPKNRDADGYLSWGSYDPQTHPNYGQLHTFALYESGLDNSPMYDKVPYRTDTHTLALADVGLLSFYIMDCHSLAEIAGILKHPQDEKELNDRAEHYTRLLNSLWDDKTGIYLNKRLDTAMFSHRLSPTNFYPMLARACTQQQAERMMKEHYFNPDEFYGTYVIPSIARNDAGFKDNDYWRGRIWGPMNFLVYLGMRNYDVKDAKADLVDRSMKLFMKNWNETGGVYENLNSVTGEGNDVTNADGFYHWGALLAFMTFIEKGYMEPGR